MDRIANGVVDIGDFRFNSADRLGHGASGTVYKGINLSNNKTVAIKEIERTYDARHERYLRDEIAHLRITRHKNIIELYHHKWCERELYQVIEYCERGDLNFYLQSRQSRLTDEELLSFMIDCAEGLHYLHSYKPPIIHRDIKAENVLVQTEQDSVTLKLTDFGFSLRSGKDATTYCGTPNYMAPEVRPDKNDLVQYNTPADIFSMGVLYEGLLNHQLGRKIVPLKGKNK